MHQLSLETIALIVGLLIAFLIVAVGCMAVADTMLRARVKTFAQQWWADYVALKAARVVSQQGGIGINTDIYQQSAPSPKINVTEREHVLWLAGKKKVNGTWAMSANAIYDIVRGNRNEVLEWIREARAEEVVRSVAVTPYAGRPYDPKQYEYTDPDLNYKAPPA